MVECPLTGCSAEEKVAMSPSGSAWSKALSPFHSVSILQDLSEPENAPRMGILLSVMCLITCVLKHINEITTYNFSYMII